MSDLENYANPDYEGNSFKYWTGKECIMEGCKGNAGTAWSPYFCFECNKKRMEKIDRSLDSIARETKEREG